MRSERWPPRWKAIAGAALLVLAVASSSLAATAPPAVLQNSKSSELKPVFPGSVQIPKEAPISRVVEPFRATERIVQQKVRYGRGYGKHPFLVRTWGEIRRLLKSRPSRQIPGQVARPTKREELLRRELIEGRVPDVEELNRIVQVFAQRARQEVRYPLMIQRQEYAKRAKGWAWEMLLNDMVPSRHTYKLLILAFGATGHHSAARWWIDWQKEAYGKATSRFEMNCLIEAFAKAGRPSEAIRHLREMSNLGLKPDARSFASVIKAWEHIGNRYEMLRWLKLYLRAERMNVTGDLMDPRDAGLPYYAMAESYVKVADAVRTMSLLKAVKDKGVPLTIEAYRLRLDVLLRVRGNRRSVDQIHRALVDFVANWPKTGPIFSQDLYERCCSVLGEERVVGIFTVHTENGGEGLVQQDTPQKDAYQQWQLANLNVAISRSLKHGAISGTSLLVGREDDDDTFVKKRAARGPMEVPDIDQGFRVLKRKAGKQGLPEWMGLRKPIRYGTATAPSSKD